MNNYWMVSAVSTMIVISASTSECKKILTLNFPKAFISSTGCIIEGFILILFSLWISFEISVGLTDPYNSLFSVLSFLTKYSLPLICSAILEASQIAEQVNGKEYSVKKLSTENNELYGSVKPTEISKLIHEQNKIDIKPSMIQPVEEIKSLGKFKVKISLHSEVDAEITINVSSADTIQ